MKKILLVLLLIFLGHSAFAMYCWEERTPNKNHTSAMTSKLGASNIVKVSTFLTATYAREVSCYTSNYASGSYTYSTTKCDTSPIGHNVQTAEYENGVSHGATTITNTLTGYWDGNSSFPYPVVSVGGYSSYKIFDKITLGGEYGRYYGDNDEEKWNYWYGTSNHGTDWRNDASRYKKIIKYIEYVSPYYTHTFCTTVGGGGGGAAGVAMNYIIKAN